MIFLLWDWLRGNFHSVSLNLSPPDRDSRDEVAEDKAHLEATKRRQKQMELRILDLEFQKAFIDHGRNAAN